MTTEPPPDQLADQVTTGVADAVTAWLAAHTDAVIAAVAEEVSSDFVRRYGGAVADRLTWSDVRMDIADQVAKRVKP